MNERIYKLFHEKNALQRYVARIFLFDLFQKMGFHITGNHFYDLTPDTREIARKYSKDPRNLPAVDWMRDQSEKFAVRLVSNYGHEYAQERGRFGFTEQNYYFHGLDSLFLYAFLRDLKPLRMIEIGQGSSTRIALAALEKNAEETGSGCEIISIDPYARLTHEFALKGVRFRPIRQELQTLDLPELLEGCGFLFVDSSHVYKFGSDVQFEFERLYPSLEAGTFVHVHDIFSPYEYPLASSVERKQFWNEQYFLENFLAFNHSFNVCLPLHLLARQSTILREKASGLSLGQEFELTGSSFYFQRK